MECYLQPSLADNFSDSALRLATILFADLRGFSAIAASHPPQVVWTVLNRCFVAMSEIIVAHHGTIDKFMGDAVMAVFSDPSASPEEDARRAVACAAEMQIAMDLLNSEHSKLHLPELYLGIGMNTGEVIAGRLGSALYSAHTVIGEEVNIAARIEAFCMRGQILISQATFERCGEFAETGEAKEVYVKGSQAGLRVREVHGIPSLGKSVPRRERRRSPRVKVTLPFTFQVVANDIVSPTAANGTITDIGYYGVQMEADAELGIYAELKLHLEFPLTGYRATDVYGRIVNAKEAERRRLFGVEFTSLSSEASRSIQYFVQMLMQGIGSADSTRGPLATR